MSSRRRICIANYSEVTDQLQVCPRWGAAFPTGL